jgi:ribonuclease P/MRP protein subunit RPP40
VHGTLLNIIKSFLCDRNQCVVVNNAKSDYCKMTSGVPQGSVLGPLLFILYINDLKDIFQNQVVSSFYADDAKIYSEINNQSDVIDFQASLDILGSWAKTWQLCISSAKCSIVDIALRDDPEIFPGNMIDDNLIISSRSKIDLGIQIDSKLKFSCHVSDVVSRAKQRVFLLFRSFSTRVIQNLLKGYVCYVLPLVSYCSQVWAPYLLADIYALESVQRLFTRRLPGLEKLSYSDRLRRLNLPSLELRRLWADLVLCYKIINGHVAGPMERYGLKFVTHKRDGRRHTMKLQGEFCRIDVRLHFFSERVVKPWNSLPVETVNASSVYDFKNKMKDFNFNAFLTFTSQDD